MEYKGLTLDKFQIDAIEAIENNHSVVVSAPTGSGKTLVADFIIDRDIKHSKRIIYTAPIKALSNQKYHDFCKEYGADKIGLLTGDVTINPRAQVLIMTTEVYRNMVLVKDESIDYVSYVIFDEIHFINDPERGYVWEESLIFSPDHIRFLCLSATIPNSREFADWIASIKNHQVDTVVHHVRSVPLKLNFYEEQFGIVDLENLKQLANIPEYGHHQKHKKQDKKKPLEPNHLHLIEDIGESKMPCLFFCFSRKACQKHAVELSRYVRWPTNPEISKIVSAKLANAPEELKSLDITRELRLVLPKGIGFHHAGLMPILKDIVEECFSKGLLKVLYATETFAVGINMPAKTVCFNSLRKYGGATFRSLNSKEYFQMAGRAGRRGMDTIGFVYVMINLRDFNYTQMKEITDDDKVPLSSQFRLSINTVLNLIHRHTDSEIEEILRKSFYTYQSKSRGIVLERTFWNMVDKLQKQGYILERNLTEKGIFASKMFCDEIEFTELFQTKILDDHDDYSVILVIAALAFEEKRNSEFQNQHFAIAERNLQKNMYKVIGKRAKYIADLTSLIYPIFHEKTFFDITKNTEMEEGDVLRLFGQILDRIGQVRRASDRHELTDQMDRCERIMRELLKDITRDSIDEEEEI